VSIERILSVVLWRYPALIDALALAREAGCSDDEIRAVWRVLAPHFTAFLLGDEGGAGDARDRDGEARRLRDAWLRHVAGERVFYRGRPVPFADHVHAPEGGQ
jgi:hypothetical protein